MFRILNWHIHVYPFCVFGLFLFFFCVPLRLCYQKESSTKIEKETKKRKKVHNVIMFKLEKKNKMEKRENTQRNVCYFLLFNKRKHKNVHTHTKHVAITEDLILFFWHNNVLILFLCSLVLLCVFFLFSMKCLLSSCR